MDGLTPLLFAGRDHILESMEGLQFRIGARSFYQTNSLQAYELYKIVRELATITSEDTVYDLYTGTGTIALFVASVAKKVVGIEYVEEAIEDARKNASNNQVENTAFYAGDMKDVLTDEFIAEKRKTFCYYYRSSQSWDACRCCTKKLLRYVRKRLFT